MLEPAGAPKSLRSETLSASSIPAAPALAAAEVTDEEPTQRAIGAWAVITDPWAGPAFRFEAGIRFITTASLATALGVAFHLLGLVARTHRR